jgi:hypothetical protein
MSNAPIQNKSASNIDDYLNERLEKEIKWHSNKAQHNKRRFRSNQIMIMMASAIIPIVNILEFGNLETRIISSILGGLIIVITGISQLEKYQQNWLLYRTTAEILKKEKWLFKHDAGPYVNPTDKNRILVERVESIVSSETSKYFTIHQSEKTQTPG